MGVSQESLTKLVLRCSPETSTPQEICQTIQDLKERLDGSIDLYPIHEEIYQENLEC